MKPAFDRTAAARSRRRRLWLVAASVAALVGTAPADALAVTKKFGAQADAHVTAAKRHANFGRARTLLVDAKPTTIAYLRFNVAVTGTVTKASLSLYPRTGSLAGVTVRRAGSKTWGEGTITYANRPAIVATPVVSSKRLWSGKRKTIDVTNLVTKSGIVTLALRTSATSAIQLASRDAASKLQPRLVVTTNSAPVCSNVALVTDEDVAGAVAPSCSDVDRDPITYEIASQGVRGTASVAAGQLRYTPNPNANGSDSFAYRASDGKLRSAPATASVTITAVNDAPVCSNVALVTDEDVAGAVAPSCSDVDRDPITYEIASQGVRGTASVAAGQLRYTPNPNANGSDSFAYRASDGKLRSAPATASVTITAVNDAPVCNGVSLLVAEDATAPGQVAPSCSDADGDALAYEIVTPGTKGVASVVSGKLSYDSNANENGSDSFTYRASDGTYASAAATVSITITPGNDAPTCDDISLTLEEDAAPVAATPGCSDVDGDALTYEIVSPATEGVASVVSGKLSYDSNANANGPDSFTYRASDGIDDGPEATVSITITAVPDAPVCADMSLTIAEDAAPVAALPDCSDADGDALTYEIVTQGAKGAASVVSGKLSYDSNANENGPDSFTYRASDGTYASAAATVDVTITAVNDRPTCSDTTLTTLEDTLGQITPPCTDVDGDVLTFEITTTAPTPTKGVASVVDGKLRYVPARDANGSDGFTYRARDASLASLTRTVSVTITPVNDRPVANLDEFATVVAGSSVDIDAKKNDLEGPADELSPQSLTVTAASDPANGSASVVGGKVRYTPDAGSTGDAFEYTVCDDGTPRECATGTISVMVVASVSPVGETAPVAHSGDAADDVAIWPHPTDPAQSLVIGTDKLGGLMVYDLAGTQIALVDSTRKLNNVDLRTGFALPGVEEPVALVAASDRTGGSWRINLYRVDQAARTLVFIRSISLPFEPYGLCMYRSVGGEFSVFVTEEDSATGHLEQWELVPDSLASGGIAASRVRQFEVGSESEGCVADDELGHLYVGEEDAGLWKYGAEPEDGEARTSVDTIAYETGHLRQDVEGLAIAYGADGTGYLIASSQGNSSFAVYERAGSNAYVKSFRVDTTADGAMDGVTVTDGIDVTTASLGSEFPNGAFIAQDNANQTPTGSANQNFKLVPLEHILGVLPPPF